MTDRTVPTDRLPSLPESPFGAGNVPGVWAAAVVTYGFGDTVTTVAAVLGAFVSTTNVLLLVG